MVTTVTNLGRSGLSDWLVQRVTAVVLVAYILFLIVVLASGDAQYAQWKSLFGQTWVRVFSLAALLSIVMHAWIGLWCVATDYLTGYVLNLKLGPFFGAKANILRLSFLAASAIVLFTYVVWGIQILWG
jgi:succinate dehydrogenase / fumarate reductase membrane anchor subunit